MRTKTAVRDTGDQQHAQGTGIVRFASPQAQFADNRPVARLQRQINESIHDSPRMVAQRRAMAAVGSGQGKSGLPEQLRSGMESLSGMAMDHVSVHYNSPRPARLDALAYTQGADIHVAPGQEKHLQHEAWHVVQQAQGRVRPTRHIHEGVPINDDRSLEREADVMGARALQASGDRG